MADVNISKYRASVVRSGSTPATPGFVVSEGQNPVEPAGSEQNHLPVTINATANALAITTDQVLSGAGTVGQYIRGDGSLADFPASTGGGSSVSYYLNGSISQGTIGGVAYKELSKTPILGSGTQFTINADGYIASFLTDAGDPNLLEIPGGNWNFETYFSASSGGGSPTFYVELYKYDGSTFTLIASNSGSPELIAFGTNVNSYFSTLAVPTTALTLTDRLAIRYYVTHSGRTITLHTENNTLCQIITTFTTGLTALNGLTAQVQYFAVGTSGTDFNIASATQTHTFNLPTASATNRGALSSADWSTFNAKQNALTLTTTGSSGASTLVGATLNVPTYTLSGLGGVPTSRQLTINGTAFDLSADRSWSVGTVTSVGLSSATSGVTIGNTPVTGSGTITLAIATASGSQQGLLSASDWSTFNNKQNTITLTTTGTSGAATLVGSTLNIPQYQSVLTNPITGTGTTNYLAKFTGSTTVGNSQVFDNGSGVGIGGTNTDSLLTINGTAGTTHERFREGSTTIGFIGGANGLITGQNGKLAVRAEAGLVLSSQGNSPDVLITSGNLLVGTTSDNGARLQVSGDARVSGILTSGSTTIGNINSKSLLIGTDGTETNYRYQFYLSSNNLLLYSRGYGDLLTVNYTTGAATFSSSVTINNASIYNRVFSDILPANDAQGVIYVREGNVSGADGLRYASRTHLFQSHTGTNYLTITSSGNVWVGNDSNPLLEIANGGSTDVLSGIRWSVGGSRVDYGGIYSATSSANNNYISFYTKNSASAPSERMRITSGGNVGIGTSSPSDIINLAGGASGSYGLVIDNSKVGGGVKAHFQYDADNQVASVAGITTNGLVFKTLTSGNVTEKMRITSSGNVGIGTSSPSSKLQIEGTGTGAWLTINRTDSGTNIIDFTQSGTRLGYIGYIGNDLFLNNATASNTAFFTNSSERMRITSGGDIIGYNNFRSTVGFNLYKGSVTRGGMYDYSSISGSGTDYSTTIFSETGQGIYFAGNGSATRQMTLTSSGNLLIGTTTDNSHKLRVNGTGYFDTGIKTGNPVGSTTNDWLLGRALVSGTSTPDRWIRVQIGNLYYDILAVYMGSV